MIKLRTILQSKLLMVLVICITSIRVVVSLKEIAVDENRIGNDKMITGIVTSIQDREKQQILKIEDMIIYAKGSFSFGERIECTGNVTVPHENSNFYLFNYRKYLASKKIYYQMNAECISIDKSDNVFYQVKNRILEIINNRKSGGYLKAFIMGDTSNIDENIMSNYRYLGISHLFAISGMHITFIVTMISFIKLKDKIILLIIPILLFYLFLAEYPPAMLRAVCFFFMTLLNKKSKLNMENICLFAYLTVCFLLYNPYFLYSTGFIYSFTISFFLILYRDILREEKNNYKKMLLITFSIFLVSLPINIQNNFNINLFSPVYNLFFVPLVSCILFPASFFVFLFPILDNLYYFIWIIVESIVGHLCRIDTIFVLCHMSVYVLIGYYIIIIFIMHKIRMREYIYIGVIAVVLLGHHFYPYIRNKAMILMLDVGQGDSTMILYPHNNLTILVDTGGNALPSSMVENITIPTLYSLGVTKIDYLILTHGDLDHMGEAKKLLMKFPVGKVLMNSGNLSDLEQDLISYMDSNKIAYEFISRDVIVHKNIELAFLNFAKSDNENEDSLVLFLNIRGKKALFMGDAGFKTEKEIIGAYNLGDLDILKVGHHGSKNSTSNEFIETTNPEVCLISAGINNWYGHPHRETLNNLQLCDTYITSIDGAIRLNIGKSILVTKVR